MSWEAKVAAFEARLRQLNNRQIEAVRYCEIDYETEIPLWNDRAEHDSLDFGLALELDNGDRFFIQWGWLFTQYCLALEPSGHWDCHRVWDVSQASRWSTLLRTEVIDTQLFWYETGQDDPDDHSHFPQDIGITFANGNQVYVSALEIREGNRALGSMDHITVIFDQETAKKYCVGPWRDFESFPYWPSGVPEIRPGSVRLHN